MRRYASLTIGLGLLSLCPGSLHAQPHPYMTPVHDALSPARLGFEATTSAVAIGQDAPRVEIAPVASYGTGFEPIEGFMPGYVGGQMSWATFISSSTEAHVDFTFPASGVQHLQIAKEPFLPVNFFVGAFSPYLGPQPVEPTTVTVEVNVSAVGNGASYTVVPQAPSLGLLTAQVVFEWTGDILVLDDPGTGLTFVDTLVDWAPGTYRQLAIEIDPVGDSIDYYYGGVLIYSSVAGVFAAPNVEEVVLYSDNWNNLDVGDFDDLLISPTGPDELSLETDDICATASQILITLWARDLSQEVTGYQAFLTYDMSLLSFNSGASQYVDDIFAQHLTAMVDAEPVAGSLLLDGSVPPADPPGQGADSDSMLAMLVFDVLTDCDITGVEFDTSGYFQSELSYQGDALVTTTINTPSITIDQLPPVVTCAPDVEVSADAGLCTALVSIDSPTASDDCTAIDPPIFYERSDDPLALLTDPFPSGTTTITWYVFDTCGNVGTCEQEVTVNAVNEVLLEVELAGVVLPTTRCLRFMTEDCDVVADVSVAFVDHDSNPSTAVRSAGTVEIPCGAWATLCVKDQQHTMWSTTTLSVVGTSYVADSLVVLESGDTDDDSDVDINDVTWLLFQFGGFNAPGGCPWDGTRDADFSNNGAVGAEDYLFLSQNWLTSSSCPCAMGDGSSATPTGFDTVLLTSQLDPLLAAHADLNEDGLIDFEDVAIFERQNGLPDTLSKRMQQTTLDTHSIGLIREERGRSKTLMP